MLIQEEYYKKSDDPWRLLVCCILLNRTTGRQVKAVLDELFSRWPTAQALGAADIPTVEGVISSLGLRKRAMYLVKMSRRYHHADDITYLMGCGQYAQDSWDIFVLGDLSTLPTDVKLKERLYEIRHSSDI